MKKRLQVRAEQEEGAFLRQNSDKSRENVEKSRENLNTESSLGLMGGAHTFLSGDLSTFTRIGQKESLLV